MSDARNRAGSITLGSVGTLQADGLITAGSTEGGAGNVTLSSTVDDIRLESSVGTFSFASNAGTVDLDAAGNIHIGGSILSRGVLRAGAVWLKAGGNAFVGSNINSNSDREAGDVSIISHGGDITTEAFITTQAGSRESSNVGVAGSITLTAASGSINVAGGLLGFGNQKGGDISVNSRDGLQIATDGLSFIQASSLRDGGSIILNSTRDIVIGNFIDTSAGVNAGDITIVSSEGDIAARDYISSFSRSNESGTVRIDAPQGSIEVGMALITYANGPNGRAGEVEIFAENDIQIGSQIDRLLEAQSQSESFDASFFGTVQTYADEMDAGDISLHSTNGNIQIAGTTYTATNNSGQTTTVVIPSVRSNGTQQSGDLTLNAAGSLTAGQIITQAPGGDSGRIAINGGSITSGNVSSIGVTSSGNIRLDSTTGSIISGDVKTAARSGQSGNITVDSQVDAILGNLRSEGGTGSGDIDVQALRDIITGDITSKAIQGDSGSVSLDAGGDITTGNIASIADNGTSGDITLEAGDMIETGTMTTADGMISITTGSSDAGNQSGSINLDDLERRYGQEFLAHLGITPTFEGSWANTEATIAELSAEQGIRTASIFIELLPEQVVIRLSDPESEPLVVYSDVDRDTVLSTIDTYRANLVNRRQRLLNRHNDYAAQLYDWLSARSPPS